MSTQYATDAEIAAQPAIWKAWSVQLAQQLPALKQWVYELDVSEIWLSGAGSSAYIGDVLAAALAANSPVPIKSVPSTDLVSSPKQFIASNSQPLLVSFGRSGNSSESVGALDVIDALLPNAPRLNITCNKQSVLANRHSSTAQQRVLSLPDATHDSGFAMTASFTTMYLSALALFDNSSNDAEQRISQLADTATTLLADMDTWLQTLTPPQRLVVLGSGCLKYAASEAALKIMELTAGDVACLSDSFLGFRHGPKSFINAGTQVLALCSSEALASRYESDLLSELSQQFPDISVHTSGQGQRMSVGFNSPLPDHWNAVLYVLVAQRVAVHYAKQLKLNVDNPFDGQNTLTRVVSGVTLYDPGQRS